LEWILICAPPSSYHSELVGGDYGGGMMRFRVPSQINLALECARADGARERLVTGVFACVRDQIRRLRERLAAHVAFVRFFACNPIAHVFSHKSTRPKMNIGQSGRDEGMWSSESGQ
jgi:hypothetical protein